jgi:hypothetical protein
LSSTVQRNEGAASATAPRLRGVASGPLAPSERITLSDEARLAARALPQPQSSQVRWYRAVRGARPAPPPAAPAPRRPIHLAVAAYLRQVPAPAPARIPAQARAA